MEGPGEPICERAGRNPHQGLYKRGLTDLFEETEIKMAGTARCLLPPGLPPALQNRKAF